MVVGTALVQLPAVWLPAAVAVALFGLAPRFSPVAWGVLVGFVALYLIGELSGFPQWVLDLEPFAHIPLVAGDDLHRSSTAGAAGDRRRADRAGNGGFPSPGRTDLRRGAMNTVVKGLLSAILGLIAFGLMLFVPAGTTHYWQGWAFLAVFALSTWIPTVYLMRTNPAALERRMQAGPTAETRPLQRILITVIFIAFPAAFVVGASRSSLRLVAGARAGLGDRRRAGRGRARPGDAGDHPKQLCGSQCQGRIGSAAGLHRVVRAGAPSDVHRQRGADARHPVGARLVLGISSC